MEEWILKEDLCIVNKGVVKTFVSSIGSSIIDVTLCSPRVHCQIQDWQVDDKYQFSDHRKITFQLSFRYVREVWTRSIKKANWKVFHKYLKSPKLQEPLKWDQKRLDRMVQSLVDKIKNIDSEKLDSRQ